MITNELLGGARNYAKWCDVQAGDKVMIVVSNEPPLVDEELVRAITLAAEEIGAEVYEMRVKPWNYLIGEPAPDYVNAAAERSDLFIGLSAGIEGDVELGRMAPGMGTINGCKQFLARYGIAWQPMRMITTEALSSEQARYPLELTWEICRTVMRKFLNGGTIRVTTPRGTDVTMGFNPDYWGGNSYRLRKPGTFPGSGFPGIVYGIVPWEPYNGTIMVDAFMPRWSPPEVFIQPDDCVITVENDRATRIRGKYGEWVANILDRDKNGRWGGEMMFGMHPHAGPVSWQGPADWFNDLHDRATALHFAFGNCMGGAGPYYSKVHFDVYVYYPTVYLNGEKVIEDGHLLALEDPGLREFAKQFGDPDYLLEEKAIPRVLEKLIKS